jgi:hypothetical protein
MIAPRRVTSKLPLLAASALGVAFVLAPGCGGDDPARYARTIELPKRETSRVNPKELAKAKAHGATAKR